MIVAFVNTFSFQIFDTRTLAPLPDVLCIENRPSTEAV